MSKSCHRTCRFCGAEWASKIGDDFEQWECGTLARRDRKGGYDRGPACYEAEIESLEARLGIVDNDRPARAERE